MEDKQCAPYARARTCQHEVYEGENIYHFDGKDLCPDCFKEEIEKSSTEQLADLVGADYKKVTF